MIIQHISHGGYATSLTHLLPASTSDSTINACLEISELSPKKRRLDSGPEAFKNEVSESQGNT